MAVPGDYLCACLYLGRVDHHMVYDAFLRNSLKGASLFSDFLCRFLFQLCDAVCDRWTADANLFYEKREDTNTGIYGHSHDCDDYLQTCAGSDRAWNRSVCKKVLEYLSGRCFVYLLSWTWSEHFLRDVYDDSRVSPVSCKNGL